MRTIGIIGGMSAESTALYHARLNSEVRLRRGGHHSARTVIWSVDFAEIERMQAEGRWDDAGAHLADAAVRLERAGAEVLLMATNTMHKVADVVERAVRIPFLHIADATGARIRSSGFTRVGLMATRYTMEQDFYAGRLRERFGLDVITPDADDRATTHRIIYDELCMGEVKASSRAAYIDIAERLRERGADCLILGCTEVGMLLDESNAPMPVFDTTLIHVDAALDWALAGVSDLPGPMPGFAFAGERSNGNARA